MSFDWDEFRRLADELRERDDEAARRTAVSRIYYAIYWKARNLLEAEGFIFRQFESSHLQVWEEYKLKGRTNRAIGISGKVLRDNRVSADYSAEIEDIEKLVEDSFMLAEKILTYLNKFNQRMKAKNERSNFSKTNSLSIRFW